MSSLDMVAYINATREPGKPELRHDSFMTKVPNVIEGYPKFIGHYLHPQNGQQYPCYNFPKREAMLMAMSYSYKLQATVYDAWQAAAGLPSKISGGNARAKAAPKFYGTALWLAGAKAAAKLSAAGNKVYQ